MADHSTAWRASMLAALIAVIVVLVVLLTEVNKANDAAAAPANAPDSKPLATDSSDNSKSGYDSTWPSSDGAAPTGARPPPTTAAGPTAAGGALTPDNGPKRNLTINWLFEIGATSVSFAPAADSSIEGPLKGTLTLSGGAVAMAKWMSDRPFRYVGLHNTSALARNWETYFGNDPPNAFLTFTTKQAPATPGARRDC